MDLKCSVSSQPGESLAIIVMWNSPGECAYYRISWTGMSLSDSSSEPETGLIGLRADSFFLPDVKRDSNYTFVLTSPQDESDQCSVVTPV